VRLWTLIIVGFVLAACAGGGVVMQNPRSGARASCGGSWSDLDPWSQTDACVGNYEAAGWVRSDESAP
jgi:hypothetical protein